MVKIITIVTVNFSIIKKNYFFQNETILYLDCNYVKHNSSNLTDDDLLKSLALIQIKYDSDNQSKVHNCIGVFFDSVHVIASFRCLNMFNLMLQKNKQISLYGGINDWNFNFTNDFFQNNANLIDYQFENLFYTNVSLISFVKFKLKKYLELFVYSSLVNH